MSFAIPVIGDASDIRSHDLRLVRYFQSTLDPGLFREIAYSFHTKRSYTDFFVFHHGALIGTALICADK